MNTNVIIYISREELRFFYSQNKNTFKTYLFNDKESIPLYFQSDGNQFNIGSSAKIQKESNYPFTYKGYFDLIKDNSSKFPFLDGEEYPISELLLKGIEYLFRSFHKEILHSDKTISEIKEELSLVVLCDSNVQDNEINFIAELFKKNAYSKFKILRFDYLVLNYLVKYQKISISKSFLLTNSLKGDLCVNFFKNIDDKTPRLSYVGESLAINPKDEIIARILFQQTIDKTGSRVNEEDELPALIELASIYSNSNRPEFRIDTTLSDGSKARPLIKMRVVEDTLSYSTKTADFNFFDSIVTKTNVPKNDIGIIVFGNTHSENFVDKLRANYNNVFEANKLSYEDYFDVILEDEYNVIQNGDYLQNNSKQAEKIEQNATLTSRSKVPNIPPISNNVEPVTIKSNTKQKPQIIPSTPNKESEEAKKDLNINNISSKAIGNKSIPPPPPLPGKNKGNQINESAKKVIKKSPIPPIPPILPPPLPVKNKGEQINATAKKVIKKSSIPPPPLPPKPMKK